MRRILLLSFLLLGCHGPTFRDDTLCFSSSMPEESRVLFSDALDEWKTKANPVLDLPITAKIKTHDCDWTVEQEDEIGTSPWLGITDPNQMTVFLKIQTDYTLFFQESLHEMGHIFCGPKHSTHEEDIMYPNLGINNMNGLTKRDCDWGNDHDWQNW